MSLFLSQWAFLFSLFLVTRQSRKDSIANEIVISLSFRMEFVMRLASGGILTSGKVSLHC